MQTTPRCSSPFPASPFPASPFPAASKSKARPVNPSLPGMRWSTSSFGAAPDASPLESLSLRDHMRRCGNLRGHLFRVRCIADALIEFVNARVITTLLVMSLAVLAVTQF